MLIKKDGCFIHIGSIKDMIFRVSKEDLEEPEQHTAFRNLINEGVQSFYFQKQNHGTQGIVLSTDLLIPENFDIEGDYIVTQKRGCAIGVLTADCLPLLFFDSKTRSIAAVHAGWRGAAAGIAQKALEHMITACGSHPADIWCYMGPSARSCCYEVGPEVVTAFEPWGALSSSAVIERNGKLFCDLISFTSDLLVSCGVKRSSIEVHPSCTIEDHAYFSYRRDGQRAGRQMTLICLR